MSHDNIHGDSLLSSISNISVKIDHTEIDDPGFFRHYGHKSIDEHEIDGEVPIDAIEDHYDIDPTSLLQQIYVKYKANQNGIEQHEQGDTWVAEKQLHGMSEEQDNSEQNSPQIKIQAKEEYISSQNPQQLSIESQQLRKLRLQQQKRLKNQTKNIPKNYGKAIITFIQKYEMKVRQILQKNNIQYQQFVNELKQKKKVINTIADLRSMWVDYKYAKCMRLLSNLFLRKYSLSYIFNSRICNYSSHIKYRYRLCEAIKQPYAFKHIKDY